MGRRTEPIRNEIELFRLLDYLEETDIPMYVLAHIMIYTAFRIGDVLKLTVADVRNETLIVEENKTKYLKRLHKKDLKDGKKRPRQPKAPREIDIHQDLKRILKEYTYGKSKSDYLFPSPRDKNKTISYSQVNRRIQKAGRSVGINDIATHMLRKTSILLVYKKDNDLAEAQNFAGHVSPKETTTYLGLDTDLRKQSVKKMDNLTDKRRKKH